MSDLLDRVVSVSLICGTVVVAAAVLYQTIHREPTPTVAAEVPEFRDDWRRGLPLGRFAAGDSTSRVTLIEFIDLECPACQSYHPTIKDVVTKHPGELSHLYVHYPLPFHKNAMAAAQAVECVALTNARLVGPFVDTTLAQQHLLGSHPWDSIASDVGLPLGIDFASCAEDEAVARRIAAGIEFAKEMGVDGTPSVMINGWIYRGLPRYRALDSLVTSLL